MQIYFGLFDESVQRCIQRRVVLVLRTIVTGRDASDLTCRHQGFRQIVIDVGVDARQRELDSGDPHVIARGK
jgi:hypothetical protein